MAATVSRRRANAIQLSRAKAADQWLPGYRRALRIMLRRQTRLAVAAFEDSTNIHYDFQRNWGVRWTREAEALKKRWIYLMVAAGYKWAEKEVVKAATGKSDKSIKGKQIGSPGPDVPLRAVIGEDDEFLIRGRFKDIDKWVETTAEAESKTKAKRLQRSLEAASRFTRTVTKADGTTYEQGFSIADIAKHLRKRIAGIDDARAAMLARTGTIWAFNEGAQQRYRSAGVTAESWQITQDDATCPYCQTMDGAIVKLDDDFASAGETVSGVSDSGKDVTLTVAYDVQHPPLHPNCRCTIVPVLHEAEAEAPVQEAEESTEVTPVRPKKWQGVDETWNGTRMWPDKKKTPLIDTRKINDTIPDFTEAKIPRKEAEKWLKARFPRIRFQLHGVDPKALNEIVRGFTKAAKADPEALKIIKKMGVFDDNQPYFGKNPKYWGFWQKNKGEIALNPSRLTFGNFDSLRRTVHQSMRSGWHPAGVSRVGHILEHEYGHALRDQLMSLSGDPIGSPQRKARLAARRAFRVFEKANKSNRFLVSRYAKTNSHEAFSEAYAQMLDAGESYWSQYTKGFKHYLNKSRGILRGVT